MHMNKGKVNPRKCILNIHVLHVYFAILPKCILHQNIDDILLEK